MSSRAVPSLASHLAVVVAGVSAQQGRHFRTALGPTASLKKEVLAAVRAVLDGGTTLVASKLDDRLSEMFREGVLDGKRVRGRFDVQLELEIAKRFTLRTDRMARRCLELARLSMELAPAPPVQQFLGRVAQCYVLGLYPESIVMCRAVVEQGVTDKFRRLKKPFPLPAPGKSEIKARLFNAEERGWLTRGQRNMAWDVCQRGNKAVHEDPHATSDVIGTIKATLEVLTALYADSSRSA